MYVSTKRVLGISFESEDLCQEFLLYLKISRLSTFESATYIRHRMPVLHEDNPGAVREPAEHQVTLRNLCVTVWVMGTKVSDSKVKLKNINKQLIL